MNEITEIIKPGLYRHFKGNLYRVIGEVFNSDTLQHMVLYVAENGSYYCRGLEEWTSPAEDGSGNIVERYRWVSN